jgi:hypothetical protein
VHDLFSDLRAMAGIIDRPGRWESFWSWGHAVVVVSLTIQ